MSGDGLKFWGKFAGCGSGFAAVVWEKRDVEIKNPSTGEVVFSGKDLEFPSTWSLTACTLVAEKYFRMVKQPDGSKKKETSVKEMINRVADTISQWGINGGYFGETPLTHEQLDQVDIFRQELKYILVNQMAAFNSPVWFNIGTNLGEPGTEQSSACFILSVEDTMESILEVAKTEGMLYKGGSGSGINYSKLRSSRETLSVGGTSSGPVPFILKDDFNAGSVKSGGSHRRSAKLACLNADHGDILEFIQCKAKGEEVAHTLIDSGKFSSDFRDRWGAYAVAPFQNANHSVRVNDEFMEAVENNTEWMLKARDGTPLQLFQASKLWEEIAKAAWFCGDPGLQFDTTINAWHTTPKSGLINASNPCSEYMQLDNSSCNLSSINVLKFLGNDGFDVMSYRHTIDIMTTAMEILVGFSKYPSPKIDEVTKRHRSLGIGLANLGALFMAKGLPYASQSAQALAGQLAAILTGRAYAQSSRMAAVVGPFAKFEENRLAMMAVMRSHQAALNGALVSALGDEVLWDAACHDWEIAIDCGHQFGYRNAQASVMAPTGTISFLMDCDTTGVEPDLSLKKIKKLVGGGTLSIVNHGIERALEELGYSPTAVESIVAYVDRHGSVVGAPGIAQKDLAVFDTSFPDPVGGRYIPWEGHIAMMAAIQPFVSGAISKTVNVPSTATVADVAHIYMTAWKKGLKAIAVYRDGCKRTQPLSTAAEDKPLPALNTVSQGRRKLPSDCQAHRHHFKIGQQSGYLHIGTYPDGSPGEVFINIAKQGSTVSGLMDAIGVLTSVALQYGVPLDVLVEKFSHTQFEPSGVTSNEEIRVAQSPLDYIFRFLGQKYTEQDLTEEDMETTLEMTKPSISMSATGTVCMNCGNTVQRAGSCMVCTVCGTTTGCG